MAAIKMYGIKPKTKIKTKKKKNKNSFKKLNP